MDLSHINGLLFETPHLFHAGKAETIMRALGPRLTGSSITIVNGAGEVDHVADGSGRPSAGVLGNSLGRGYRQIGATPFDMIDGVAIIPIEGTLVHKGAWVGDYSGRTSYQGIRAQLDRAGDSDVKGVVFEIDSFGGLVSGAFETAEAMRQLSAVKPTIAILTDYAYSAGYLLASQARSIIMPEFGGAGSIGVVMMHADYSGALDKTGIKVTFIHSGAHKIEGNPYQSLPQHVLAKWQAEADAMRDRFADQVGKGRGTRFGKEAALKTEAQAFSAKDARRLGLVDAVGDVHEGFQLFINQVGGKRSKS